MNIAKSAALVAGIMATGVAVRPVAAQQQQSVVQVPRAVLEKYVGEYVFPSGNTVVVRLQGDTLIREAGASRDIYTPISETKFMMPGSVILTEFLVDKGGVTQVLSDVTANNKELFRIPRKAAGAKGASQGVSHGVAGPGVKVPTSVLERYVGEYQMTPTVTAEIAIKGDMLVRKIMGQEQPMPAISETKFRLGGAEAEFVVDDKGGVTMVVSGQGEQKRYPRKPKI